MLGMDASRICAAAHNFSQALPTVMPLANPPGVEEHASREKFCGRKAVAMAAISKLMTTRELRAFECEVDVVGNGSMASYKMSKLARVGTIRNKSSLKH